MTGRVVHVKDNVPGAVYIGRATRSHPKGSILGNPFKIGRDGTRAECVQRYRDWLPTAIHQYPAMINELIALRGHDLACWCRHENDEKRIGNACHGDVLLDLLERYTDDELRAMSEVTS